MTIQPTRRSGAALLRGGQAALRGPCDVAQPMRSDARCPRARLAA